jgi:ABC-type glycerol-3-phosphate transport system substrate-binding protein
MYTGIGRINFGVAFLAVLILSALLAGCGGASNKAPSSDDILDPDPADTVKNTIKLTWDAPVERENTAPLLIGEIAGYEINYRHENDATYSTQVINDSHTTEYLIEDTESGQYEIVIYAFDIDGLYSIASETVRVSI